MRNRLKKKKILFFQCFEKKDSRKTAEGRRKASPTTFRITDGPIQFHKLQRDFSKWKTKRKKIQHWRASPRGSCPRAVRRPSLTRWDQLVLEGRHKSTLVREVGNSLLAAAEI